MRLQLLASIVPRGAKMEHDGTAHFLPSRTKGEGVNAALPQLNLTFRTIARRAIAGLSATVFIGTAALAQAPRSVTILPDVPEVPEAAPAPNISPMRLELLNSTVKVENPAGVSVDLIPKLEVSAGSKIGFRIAAKKTGYLILLDIAASGKLSQIFPNPTAVTSGMRDVPNLIKPGRPLTIPQLGTPYAGFEFVANLPAGIAMVVALLSDKPVQVVDLPDTPPPAVAPDDALKYVRDQARILKVPSPGGQLEQPNWSIDGKFYLIK
jgi:uncharacterized protein DUF4384